MQLLFLVFGNNLQNHFQAHFSILSFLRQKNSGLAGITVVTDAPDFYLHLAQHITVHTLDAHTLQEWQGEYRFFWRAKIKALEYAVRQHPEAPLLYLDTDTFLHGSLAKLRQELSDGVAFMHEAEGPLASLTSKTERRMWQQVKDRSFGGVAMHEQLLMWNAGVVGIPASKNLEAVGLALRICDELCEQQVTPRLIEQFALSVALAETYTLRAARAHLGHYWSTKDDWNASISAFFLESHLKKRTVEAELAAMSTFDYQNLPIKQKVRNTQRRLENLVQRLFPPQQVNYIE
ncbi:hypothetical protein GCM10011375_18140 [Hymenobacter qilianensis]|uniref:Uncharacterized protein n=2 Tax=Hymenobacter qilianensis TaxID=1385715 RepID=A0ACB5PQX2_9BACT|nr:hypothetical protein [Hymenobacter qilianensis]QNP52001.1 hypothetical protein H9L05_19165 [Hymenobacter qilianensis]GGF63581.1 hypothetical protein GCM10011375_18140 [Hymenobacter qilianensis]